MTKDYDKLLGRDDTEKVLVDVTNYFVSMKPIRTLQKSEISIAYLRQKPQNFFVACNKVLLIFPNFSFSIATKSSKILFSF